VVSTDFNQHLTKQNRKTSSVRRSFWVPIELALPIRVCWRSVWPCDYNEVDPIILSVAENDEISIKEVADMIAEAMAYPLDRIKVPGSHVACAGMLTCCLST